MTDSVPQVTFGLSTLPDKPEMAEILTDCFTTSEALHRSLAKQGVHSIDDFRNTFTELVDNTCGNDYTIVARDGPKVVGVLLAWATTCEEYLVQPAMRHIPLVQVFMDKCYENRTENLPDEKFIYISYCGVREEYRRRGIGGKMTDVLLGKVKEENCWPAVFVECLSLYTQSSMSKLGFEVMAELKFEDYKDENGELILKHTEPHPSAQFMLLKLK